MARINPYAGKRAERLVETKEFSDPAFPKEVLDITLQAQDDLTGALAVDVKEDLVARYITGDARRGLMRQEFKLNRSDPEEEPIPISDTLCQNVANVYVMQTDRANPKEEKYTPEELIALCATRPVIWRELCLWVVDLNRRNEMQAGNASGADGDTK